MGQTNRSSEGFERQRWIPAQTFVPLAADEVQVWRVRAVGQGGFYEACLSLLSPDELERWRRLRAGVGRDEFVIARGCLRALLGAALRQDPRAIALSIGNHGKPFVEGVKFNVTHSKGLVLLAINRNAEVGIDAEWMDADIEALEIAQDTFAPGETAQIATAQGEERVRQFYRCWVRKEAVTKAHGQGITLSLRDFQVDFTPEHETTVTVSSESGSVQDFYVRGLPLTGRFTGALALTSPGCPVRLFELSPETVIGIEACLTA